MDEIVVLLFACCNSQREALDHSISIIFLYFVFLLTAPNVFFSKSDLRHFVRILLIAFVARCASKMRFVYSALFGTYVKIRTDRPEIGMAADGTLPLREKKESERMKTIINMLISSYANMLMCMLLLLTFRSHPSLCSYR